MAKQSYNITLRTAGECSNIYIGCSWSSVKNDETGRQFKDRIEAEIEKLLGSKTSCGTHSAAWYNG
jgi:hypothetical protein